MQRAMDRYRGCLGDRRSWSGVLNRILTPQVLRDVGEGQPRDGNQARAGWTPKFLLVLCVCIGWSWKRRLTGRFGEARAIAAALYPDHADLPGSYQGFFKQLGKANVSFLRSSVSVLRKEAPCRAGESWWTHNWIVFAADGSRIEAPRTKRNQKWMGRAGRKGTGPQLWATLLVHLPTGLVWDWQQGPGTSSERSHLRALVPTLPERALVVTDAGFVGYDGMQEMAAAGQAFLMRCGGNVELLLQDKPVTTKLERSRTGTRVYLWPQAKQRQGRAPLVLRLIVLKRKKQKVYLLTNVMSATALPKWMAGEIYAARWGIEVTYRSLKQTMERRKLLSKSPENATLELAANLLGLFMLVLHGLSVLGPQCGRLSVAMALDVLRDAMEALRWGVVDRTFRDRLAAAVRDEYERTGRKRARDWPHKKTESPPGPPRLRRVRSAERARLRRLDQDRAKTG